MCSLMSCRMKEIYNISLCSPLFKSVGVWMGLGEYCIGVCATIFYLQ